MDGARCVVCGSAASHLNYGVIACEACKMFFARHACFILRCKFKGKCLNPREEHCRSCRLKIARDCGMRLTNWVPTDLKPNDNWMEKMIEDLVTLDTQREEQFHGRFSKIDPTVLEIVEMGASFELAQRGTHHMSITDWRFVHDFTAIQFLMKPDFMQFLNPSDKVILLKNVYFKASFSFWGFRMYQDNIGSLQTPLVDGVREEIYPDSLHTFPLKKKGILKLRQTPVAIFQNTQMSRDEMLLLLMIMFCDPAVSGLSQDGIDYVTNHRNVYSSVLQHFCKTNYGNRGVARFAELLSLCWPLQRCEDNLKVLMIFIRSEPSNEPIQRIVCDEA